mgnify:FL=1
MADWSRIVNTTIREYVRGETVNVLRNRKVTAMLKSKGRISLNHSGDGIDWKIRYKRAPLIGYADTDTLTFSRRDRWKTAFLDWRGYAIVDSMTKQEKLKNKSTEAIVKIYDSLTRNLMEDAEDQFGDEFYIDGYASGNSRRMHGIESFMGNTGVRTTVPIAVADDAYANLDTDEGAYGGTWTGNWPIGTGDAHYDFWTPLLIDYTSAITPSSANVGWSASTKTWANTCVEAVRFAIIHSRKNKSAKGMLDFILLNDELFRNFIEQQAAKERLNATRGQKAGGLSALGFDDTFNFDGVEVTYEYGVASNLGYGWNIDQMELKSLQGELFVPEGPDYDIASKSWRFSIDFFGNICFNPRFFTKFKNYS